MTSLLVMVPTRGRPAQCERLLESFRKTTDDAHIIFILDEDDEDTYRDNDWADALRVTVGGPRQAIQGKFNHVADFFKDDYDALMACGDDHVFRTEHWDSIMLRALADMGGTGWVYPDDKRRHDIPEIPLGSTDLVKALSWWSSPTQQHYYADNIIGDLGRKSGLLRYCPQVVIEHLHYSVCKETVRDETYRYPEDTWGASDLQAYHQWRAEFMPYQVAMLRREFNPDLRWLMDKI